MSGHRTFALPVALVAAGLCTACDGGDGPSQERQDAFVWEGEAGPGTTLRVRDMNGDIEVTHSTGSSVKVHADIEWRRGNPDESLHFSGFREGNDIMVCAVWGKGSCTKEKYDSQMKNGNSTDAKVHFRIEVPAGVRLDLIGINGDIAATASAPVEARTANGDIRIATAVGPARGETVNGSVDLRMSSLAGTDSVIAKSMNGDVYVYLPGAPDVSVDLSTMSGSVSSEFPVMVTGEPNKRSLKATLGSGVHPVRLRTLNGDAAIRKLDSQGRSASP